MLSRFLRVLIPALVLAVLPAVSSAGVFFGISVDIAPPPLPIYVQPPCPQPGYLWVPGYWAWGPFGYYWVPGTWVLPPQVGLLWTPGYWGWEGAAYVWHAGYWGPRVGFYGGIDYGFGYDGDGFDGGYWRRGVFFYNRAVARVGPTFARHVYYRPMRHHRFFDHVSYNGGRGGIFARPTRADLIAAREHRMGFTAEQLRHERLARGDRSLRADFNHGKPPIAATPRPAMFRGRGVRAARAAGGPMRMMREPARRRPRFAQPQRRYARPQFAQPQRRYARPQFAQPQRRYARPQFAQPQRRYARPQFAQPQRRYARPRFTQPQRRYARPRFTQPQRRFAQPQPRFNRGVRRARPAPVRRGPMIRQRAGGHPPDGRRGRR